MSKNKFKNGDRFELLMTDSVSHFMSEQQKHAAHAAAAVVPQSGMLLSLWAH
jgi:hypothetical protein